MRKRIAIFLFAAVACFAAPKPASGQGAPGVPLEDFIQQVAWLWNMGDVAALVDLLQAQDRVVLDTGSGTEAVQPRHAAAALRALFDSRQTGGARAVRATIAGGDPPRGFGELSWSFRSRNAPTSETRSVFVGAVWQGDAWRINELRVMH